MMRTVKSMEFESIWRRVREDSELIPNQSQLQPAVLKNFLRQIVVFEIDVPGETFTVKLAGEDIRSFMGSTGKGLDTNSIAEPGQLPAHLERQKAYHDHPVGRATLTSFSRADGVAASFEQTLLPVQGSKGDRLIYMLVVPIDLPVAIRVDDEVMTRLVHHDELLIDVGKGLLTFQHALTRSQDMALR